jgi:hypothetical protein
MRDSRPVLTQRSSVNLEELPIATTPTRDLQFSRQCEPNDDGSAELESR